MLRVLLLILSQAVDNGFSDSEFFNSFCREIIKLQCFTLSGVVGTEEGQIFNFRMQM